MSKWNQNFLAAILQQSANSDLKAAADAGDLRLLFLDDTYTASDAHEFLDDVSANGIGTAVVLSGVTVTNGIVNGTVPDYDGAELDTETAGFAQLYIHTGTPSTSRLVYLFDSEEAQLPFTGLGEDQPFTLPALPLCDTSGSEDNVYPLFAEALLDHASNANSDVSSGTLTVVGVNGDYTFDAADEFLAGVAAGQRTGTPQVVGSKTYTAGLLGGAAVTFSGGVTDCRGFLYYIDTTVEATSRVVGVKRNIQALPGGGLTTASDLPLSHASGIFQLGAEYTA